MSYILTTPDPINGKPRKRATELWKDTAIAKGEELAAKYGKPVDVLHVRTRGGVPRLVDTIHPQAVPLPPPRG